jgi:hypothetical protein
MGAPLEWVPWLRLPKRADAVDRAAARLAGRIGGVAPIASVTDLLDRVAGCAVVVTDLYHLCVNSWRMGVLAVCVGSGTRGDKLTLDDFKKRLLYSMFGADGLYLDVAEAARGRRDPAVERLLSAIETERETGAVASAIRRHAESVGSEFRAALAATIAGGA